MHIRPATRSWSSCTGANVSVNQRRLLRPCRTTSTGKFSNRPASPPRVRWTMASMAGQSSPQTSCMRAPNAPGSFSPTMGRYASLYSSFSSGPHDRHMGNAQSSIRSTMARRDLGHARGGPKLDAAQSKSRILACIRLLPVNISLSSAMLLRLSRSAAYYRRRRLVRADSPAEQTFDFRGGGRAIYLHGDLCLRSFTVGNHLLRRGTLGNNAGVRLVIDASSCQQVLAEHDFCRERH